MWWYKTLYQIESVVWTSITTSHDSKFSELWCGMFTQQARPDTKSCINTLMYVICLSNISIKTNFKQIKRVELKIKNLYNTLRETSFCAWHHVICCRSFFCIVYVAYIDVFSLHSNDMTSWQNSSTEKIWCNVTPFFYHQVWWYNILYQTPCIRQATFFKFKGKRTRC
jgi:hypothetical protein